MIEKTCVQRAAAQDRPIPGGARLLDAGCGTGRLCELAKAQGLGWHITGADIAEGMCQAARSKHGIEVMHADLAALPVANHQFDAALSSLVLQWVDARAAVLAELRRVIKPGGVVVIATLLEDTLQELQSAFALVDEYEHVSAFDSVAALRNMLEQGGFTLLDGEMIRYCEYYPDVVSIMRSLKQIGARNKREDRKRGLTTPRSLRLLEEYYKDNFHTPQGLPVTWNVGYCVVRG